MRAILVVTASWLMTLAATSLADEANHDILIQNVTTIDAISRKQANQSVLIRDGQISMVDNAGKISATASIIIEGTDKFLIPGLWDMHVHIIYEPRLTELMPRLFLDYGVTSVRDTGALLHEIQPEILRWRSMGALAPDIFFSGPLLDGSLVVYDGNGRTEIGTPNATVASADEQIAQLHHAGIDFIKIYELVSPEVFNSMIQTAHRLGLPIAAHVPLSMKADEAGPQVNSMEHLRNIEIACADNANQLHKDRKRALEFPGNSSGYELRSHLHNTQRTVALKTATTGSKHCQQVIRSLRDTIQVPTLRLNTISRFSPELRPDWNDQLKSLPKDVAAEWMEIARYFAAHPSELGNQMSDWSLALVEAMHRAGVPIGAGTDTPIGQAIPGYSLHTELERLVAAGLNPLEAMASATIAPASFFKLTDTIGQIQPGMEADLVLLHADPLVDIRNTRAIVTVISDGQIVR